MKLINYFKLFEYDNYSELYVWTSLGVCDPTLTINAEGPRL